MSYLRNDVLEGQQLSFLQSGEIKRWGDASYGIKGKNIRSTEEIIDNGIALDEKILQRHLLCLGSIGSGKSVTLFHIIDAIRKGATENDVFVFFDAKGDYLEEFYRDGDYVISNHSIPPSGAVTWNVYQDIMATPQNKRDETIKEIATALFREDIEKSGNPVFSTGARDLFAAILSAQSREMETEGTEWDHEKLVSWLQKATDKTIRILLQKHADLKWVRNYMREDRSESSKQSFFQHLYQNIFSIFSGEFAKKGQFSIKDAVKKKGGKAIFLEYDLASGSILSPVYTLLLDLIMKDVLGRSSSTGNIYFILDEFPLIPRLNYMDNALNFGRSLGVKVIAGIQNVGQVYHVYGPELGESIISGFGTMFAFRLFDEPSRTIVQNRHGRNKKIVSIGSSNAARGVQDTIIEGNVIEDWDLTSLRIGECIVSPFNGEPFLFYPINY
ncbi:type IV secretory system conjugative DNA transfer family protein [Priestia megaterium]|uniref:type IV secretory system conjugative DNA transfer family protein n=1 Tax=Priestia megaterium TaxID=1404 RepID=UPI0039ED240C